VFGSQLTELQLAAKSVESRGSAVRSKRTAGSAHRGSSAQLSARRRQFNSVLGIGIDAPVTSFGAGSNDPYGSWLGGQSKGTPWDRYRDEDSDDEEEDLYEYSVRCRIHSFHNYELISVKFPQ